MGLSLKILAFLIIVYANKINNYTLMSEKLTFFQKYFHINGKLNSVTSLPHPPKKNLGPNPGIFDSYIKKKSLYICD